MKLFILTLSLLILSPSTYANLAKILFIKGDVKSSNNKTLKKMDTLKLGEVITTGKSSIAVIQLPKGSKIKIDQSSSVRIEHLPKAGQPLTALSLVRGSSFIKVKKGTNPKKNKFVLKTRTTAMGVRGTEFFASFGKNDDVWMCVNEGVVAVKSKTEKKATLVKKGEGIVVKKGKKTSSPKPLEWTKKLNWNMDPKEGKLENKVSIKSAYSDLLNEDYD